jgi:hypothetical protein
VHGALSHGASKRDGGDDDRRGTEGPALGGSTGPLSALLVVATFTANRALRVGGGAY